jgi:hypothetical protein
MSPKPNQRSTTSREHQSRHVLRFHQEQSAPSCGEPINRTLTILHRKNIWSFSTTWCSQPELLKLLIVPKCYTNKPKKEAKDPMGQHRTCILYTHITSWNICSTACALMRRSTMASIDMAPLRKMKCILDPRMLLRRRRDHVFHGPQRSNG